MKIWRDFIKNSWSYLYFPTFFDLESGFWGGVDIFFNTHDPTTLNRQGNDSGTQYRSAIFCANEDEKRTVINFIKNLYNSDKIVTEVNLLDVFYPAEEYHKNYYNMNKSVPYCSNIITPKISKFMSSYKDILK